MTQVLNQTQFIALIKIRSSNFTAGTSKNENTFIMTVWCIRLTDADVGKLCSHKLFHLLDASP